MTLIELAKQIGCSRATLDRVINNREGVSDERRKEILRKIEEYGYKPNLTGKMLSKQSRTSIGIIVGLDMTPIDSHVFSVIQEGMMECCKNLEQSGIKFIFKHLTNGSAEEHIELIHELVHEGVVGIAFSFRKRTKELYETIKSYSDRGIKFLPYFAASAENNNCMSFPYQLGTDQTREGYVAAGILGRYLKDGGKVALISGLEENVVHQERINSAKELLEREYQAIELLPVYRNAFPKETVERIWEDLCVNHPDLRGIIVSCGFARDIMEFIARSGKKDQIFVVSYDFTNSAIRDLKAGRCDALIGVDLKRLGYKAILAIRELVFKDEVDSETLYAPLEILFKESIIPLP